MGSGIDAARANAPEHARLMDDMKDQLVLVLFRRLMEGNTGRRIRIPVAEIDDTGGLVLLLEVDAKRREFVFELRSKQ